MMPIRGALKPWPHGGGTSLHVLRDILIEPHRALNSAATQKIRGAWWRLTRVAHSALDYVSPIKYKRQVSLAESA